MAARGAGAASGDPCNRISQRPFRRTGCTPIGWLPPGLERNSGFVEGRNVVIEFVWADGQYDRLPSLAGELVRRPISLIIAQTPPAALAAKAATATIPIVFVVGFDPAAGGLVASLAQSGGNITGLSLQLTDVAGKRLGLLRDLAPNASVIAMLVNPISPNAAPEIADVHGAAQAMGLQVKIETNEWLDLNCKLMEKSDQALPPHGLGPEPQTVPL